MEIGVGDVEKFAVLGNLRGRRERSSGVYFTTSSVPAFSFQAEPSGRPWPTATYTNCLSGEMAIPCGPLISTGSKPMWVSRSLVKAVRAEAEERDLICRLASGIDQVILSGAGGRCLGRRCAAVGRAARSRASREGREDHGMERRAPRTRARVRASPSYQSSPIPVLKRAAKLDHSSARKSIRLSIVGGQIAGGIGTTVICMQANLHPKVSKWPARSPALIGQRIIGAGDGNRRRVPGLASRIGRYKVTGNASGREGQYSIVCGGRGTPEAATDCRNSKPASTRPRSLRKRARRGR